MSKRESVYEKASAVPSYIPSLGTVADYIEYLSFAVLTAAVLSFAGMGVAIALNGAAWAVVLPFLSASGGLLLTFVSLFILAILVDGGSRYRAYISSLADSDENRR